MASITQIKRVGGVVLELLLGLFFLSLLLVNWNASHTSADSNSGRVEPESVAEPARSGNLIAVQGSTLIGQVNGSISNTDLSFFGQRHVISGFPGDPNCAVTGTSGTRFYDVVTFSNNSSSSQRIVVNFTSSCGTNTYMAAFSPGFNPANICENFLAGAGFSGNVDWQFTVCANSTFSIVVYGREPGLTCSSYTYFVFGQEATSQGKVISEPPSTVAGNDAVGLPAKDGKTKKLKHKRRADTKRRIILPEATRPPDILLPLQGTTLVATITGSIDGTEPTFTGQRHFRSGLPSDPNCVPFGQVAARPYDEVFFLNNSSTPQRVSVAFTALCGGNTYMAAFSPQFDPTNICANFIASSGLSGNINWEFTVCANSQFSIVVYGLEPGLLCSQYSYTVSANGVILLGTTADLAVSKTGPPGPVNVGSTITYNITISNNGPNPATGITFNDTLPTGTTFAFLSTPSTALVCTTPPVGSPGTVSCMLNMLAAPGTILPNSLTFMLGVNVTSSAGASIMNTATVSRPGIDPNPGNNSSTATTTVNGGFDICIQDDANGDILRFNSTTGNYQFFNCRKGITLTGRGVVSRAFCKIELRDSGPDPKRPDRSVTVQANPCTGVGIASVFIFSTGQTVTINDSNIANNTCTCP
jgi:uncharacterized repeat protein (TIGR01451 family)